MVTYWRNWRTLEPATKQGWWVVVSLVLILKCRASNMENIDKTQNTANMNVECPAISDNSACPCYKFEDGEFKSFFISNL